MLEYMSLKVQSDEHGDLATQLTTLSTQGWNVVNIVSTGTHLVAYVSRPAAVAGEPHIAPAASASDTGWAAASGQVSTSSPAAPAKWYPDPSGRYEYRYWDGSKWTDNVSRAGVMYKDPPIP